MNLTFSTFFPSQSKDSNAPFFFHERFTVDAEEDDYKTEVEVPDFKGGRHGRFLHDFRRNLTAIIDVTGGRCFIMPLDSQHVLRPSSLVDVLTQMNRGNYQVTSVCSRFFLPPIFCSELYFLPLSADLVMSFSGNSYLISVLLYFCIRSTRVFFFIFVSGQHEGCPRDDESCLPTVEQPGILGRLHRQRLPQQGDVLAREDHS
jgi:hypothetical protein